MATWHKNVNNLRNASLFPALQKQCDRLAERRSAVRRKVEIQGAEFDVFPGVYQTSIDTELMLRAVKIRPTETFLEIGVGCGVISLLLARRCGRGVGVDINPLAIENSVWNQSRLNIKNVDFVVSDVFSKVTGKFDVIVCNPPYNDYCAGDTVERMFWDPANEMKRRVFEDAKYYLNDKGRIYFGWADFADLDTMLPVRLASRAGFKYFRHFVEASRNGVQRFFVIEFRPFTGISTVEKGMNFRTI